MDLRATIAESELVRTLAATYGWPAAVQAYFVDGIASPIETLSYGGIDDILNLAQESGMRIQEDGIVLDAGCGAGVVTILARQRGIHIIGVDSGRASLDLAWQLGRIVGITEEELSSALVLGDIANLSYPDDHFSMIVSYQVVEHVDDIVAMLRELIRCLKPGGFLSLTGPDYRFPFEPHYKIPWLPYMEEVAAISWLEVFGRPVEGLSTFNYVSLPHCLEVLSALDVEIVQICTTIPEEMIEEQRRLLLGDEDEHSLDAGMVRALAMRAKQNDIQTIEAGFRIAARKD
jgi:ubiquinone/menaquinone biosynthesis C-methylase UbiE